MSKKCLITGITGQSGSYLAELLLVKGYDVHGMIRRSSSFNTGRIDHIYDKVHLHYGDMTDSLSIDDMMYKIKPDYIFNLAAQSHVAVSFNLPEYTAQTDGIGTLRILEAMKKHVPESKLYQASTSELFGRVLETPQSEKTPFNPVSPYAIAKQYAFNMVKNYREAYDMFASNGILFNHETMVDFTPMIFKEGNEGEIDIKPISEIVKFHTKDNSDINTIDLKYQETEVTKDLYIWDINNWTKVKFASCYPHDVYNNNKKPRYLISKNSAYMGTSSHVCIMENEKEKKISDIKIGDKVNIINYPKIEGKNIISEIESEFLGFLVGDGNKNIIKNNLKLTGKKTQFLDKYADLWIKLGGDVYKYQCVSGFNTNEKIWQYTLNGNKNWINKYTLDIYDENHKKRVPKIILNSNKEIQNAFLIGYNNADGLKKNKSVYNFKNFKTNSATLAAGLLFLLNNTTKQEYNINVENIFKFGENRLYYSINILSDSNKGQNHKNSIHNYETILNLLNLGYSQRRIFRETNISRTFIKKVKNGYVPNNKHHLEIPNNTIKKIIEMDDYDGWFYDLETESGTFHAGIGQGHVHNSPRRGETFVTKKITRGLVDWLKTKDPIHLGNLNAKRDWGYAPEYCEAMIKIIDHSEPDDFVIATGEAHSNKEFVEEACKYVNIDIEWRGEGIDEIGVDKRSGDAIVIQVDPKYFRPSEVDLLLGDPSKAKRILGWEAKTKFKDLVKLMMESDIEKYGEKNIWKKYFKK